MTFKASDIGKNTGVKDLLQNRVQIPKLSASYLELAKKITEKVIKTTIDRGFSR